MVAESDFPDIPIHGEPALSPPPESIVSGSDVAPSGWPSPTESAAGPVPAVAAAQPPYAPPPTPYSPPPYAPPVMSAQDNPNKAPVHVGFVDAIKRAYSHYATFSGRASRSEFWWFYLLQMLVSVPLSALSLALSTQVSSGSSTSLPTGNLALSGIGNLWSLANFIPILAITWRRLHDSNKSGWWYGAGLIGGAVVGLLVTIGLIATVVSSCSSESCSSGNLPGVPAGLIALGVALALAYLAYGITMLVFLVRRGDEGANKYGPGYSASA